MLDVTCGVTWFVFSSCMSKQSNICNVLGFLGKFLQMRNGVWTLKAHSWRWANHITAKGLVEVDTSISEKDSCLSHSTRHLPQHWPPSRVLSHLASHRSCLFSLCYTSASVSFWLAPHTNTSALTVSLRRRGKKPEESIFRYSLLLLTEEKPQRWAPFIDEKEARVQLCGRFL